MLRAIPCLLTVALALCGAPSLAATGASQPAEAAATHQFTFAWPFSDQDAMRPRGGTSTGAPVTLDPEPSSAWLALQEGGLPDFERDRRAILAMAGPYRTSFDFIETIGFTTPYTPPRPYQSWGTEYVYVAADEGRFISLQHILVMFFEEADGTISGPMVVKHWRQDWRYEDRDMHVYLGDNTWQHRRLTRREASGAWTQAVYQVDDSPRYESSGRWRHEGSYSSWQSGDTWRPLPRREFSVRDDYQVLDGTNRHTITPTGWVQEEDNLKLVLTGPGQPRAEMPVLAREVGLNRYEHITGHDFSAGDAYWQRTRAFWTDVRLAWERVYATHETFTLRTEVGGRKLFEVMFEYADGIDDADDYDTNTGRAFIDETLERYLD
jgi:hypothetical protein